MIQKIHDWWHSGCMDTLKQLREEREQWQTERIILQGERKHIQEQLWAAKADLVRLEKELKFKQMPPAFGSPKLTTEGKSLQTVYLQELDNNRKAKNGSQRRAKADPR